MFPSFGGCSFCFNFNMCYNTFSLGELLIWWWCWQTIHNILPHFLDYFTRLLSDKVCQHFPHHLRWIKPFKRFKEVASRRKTMNQSGRRREPNPQPKQASNCCSRSLSANINDPIIRSSRLIVGEIITHIVLQFTLYKWICLSSSKIPTPTTKPAR